MAKTEEQVLVIKRELFDELGSFQGPAGTFRQRSEITASQGAILAPLQLAAPPRLQEIRPAAAVS